MDSVYIRSCKGDKSEDKKKKEKKTSTQNNASGSSQQNFNNGGNISPTSNSRVGSNSGGDGDGDGKKPAKDSTLGGHYLLTAKEIEKMYERTKIKRLVHDPETEEATIMKKGYERLTQITTNEEFKKQHTRLTSLIAGKKSRKQRLQQMLRSARENNKPTTAIKQNIQQLDKEIDALNNELGYYESKLTLKEELGQHL